MTAFDDIMEVASYQDGYVATYQLDVSRQMFSHYHSTGRLVRIIPGIYRLDHYGISEDEDLIVAYLWSRQKGVLSHQTALSCHELSDALPKCVHLSFPIDESLPPQEAPQWLRLHRADVPDKERQWYHSVPLTTPARTLIDLACAGFTPELFHQALDEALKRAIVPEDFERRIIDELMNRQRRVK